VATKPERSLDSSAGEKKEDIRTPILIKDRADPKEEESLGARLLYKLFGKRKAIN